MRTSEIPLVKHNSFPNTVEIFPKTLFELANFLHDFRRTLNETVPMANG
jgi:hypothetical protein